MSIPEPVLDTGTGSRQRRALSASAVGLSGCRAGGPAGRRASCQTPTPPPDPPPPPQPRPPAPTPAPTARLLRQQRTSPPVRRARPRTPP
ncbi:hypothetical protein BMH29_07570, partial [Leucobacter sp. OLDS2]